MGLSQCLLGANDSLSGQTQGRALQCLQKLECEIPGPRAAESKSCTLIAPRRPLPTTEAHNSGLYSIGKIICRDFSGPARADSDRRRQGRNNHDGLRVGRRSAGRDYRPGSGCPSHTGGFAGSPADGAPPARGRSCSQSEGRCPHRDGPRGWLSKMISCHGLGVQLEERDAI